MALNTGERAEKRKMQDQETIKNRERPLGVLDSVLITGELREAREGHKLP